MDETRCPICGGENQCAQAAGHPPRACWCMHADVPEALIEAVPAEARNRRCICRRCVAYGHATGRLRQCAAG
jgi:hypothetical protein